MAMLNKNYWRFINNILFFGKSIYVIFYLIKQYFHTGYNCLVNKYIRLLFDIFVYVKFMYNNK